MIPNLGFLELKFETNFFIGSMDLRIKIIEVFVVLILLAESAWVLFSLQHKLNLPTVQSRAMHLLIQFALETEEQKQEILLQAEKERIYFWPGNGMPIVSDLSLAERLDGVLSESYGEEYRSLPEEELRMMREDTLPWLEQSVLARMDTWKSVNFPDSLTHGFLCPKTKKVSLPPAWRR